MNDVLSDSTVEKVIENIETLKVDVKSASLREKELINFYGVRGVPTLIFISNNEELLRIPGAITKDDFLDLLCKNFKKIPSIEEECSRFFYERKIQH